MPAKNSDTSLEQRRPLSTRELATERLLARLKLDPSTYKNLSLTPEQTKHLQHFMTNLSTGSTAAIPLTCAGQRCPFSETCPLHQIGQAPIGESCLFEVKLLQLWREQFVLEYDIDPESMTELFLVNELAEVELMLYRLNRNLAKPEHAELVQDEVVAVSREGNTLTKRAVSAFLIAKETLLNRRNKVIKFMVGDRQEKYKRDAALKLRTDNDPSKGTAELRRELQSLIQAAKAQSALSVSEATPLQLSSSSSGPNQEGKVINIDEEPLSPPIRKPMAPEDLISDLFNSPPNSNDEKKE